MNDAAAPVPAAPPLNQVYFYLVEGCNLACRHCWLAPKFDPGASRTPVLPVELFEKVIREAKPLGLSGIKLTGGEPLLHPRFDTLLDIVEGEGLDLTIETNGLLVTPALAKRIAGFPSRFVSVSLDGADAQTHEWVRGVPGSFAAATRAVQCLAEAGAPPQVIFSLMRGNAHQVEDIIRLSERLGASSVKFNIIQPTARGARLHEVEDALTIPEYIEIGRKVDSELASRTGLRLCYDYPPAFRPLSRLAADDAICGILGIIGVLASGHYALCGIGEHIPEFVFGDVRTSPLTEIWLHHPLLAALRRDLPGRLEGICSTCLMAGRCFGACVAQNMYRTSNLLAPFWFCEEAQRGGVFPSSRLKSLLLSGS